MKIEITNAGADYTSPWFTPGPHGISVDIVCNAMTGTYNGAVHIEWSNVNPYGANGNKIDASEQTLDSANKRVGVRDYTLTNVEFARVVYTHTGITGGTIDIYIKN